MLKRVRKIMLILLSVLMLHSLLPIRIYADNNESTPSIVSNNEALFEKEGGFIFSIGIIGNGLYDVNKNGKGWLSDWNSSNKYSFDSVQNLELIAKAAEGHSFAGWYEAKVDKYNTVNGITNNLISTDNPYSTTLNSDLFIAAVFEENITVTFNTRGGSLIESQSIAPGSKATRPTDPTINGIYFDNWYTDENFTTVFDFNTSLYNNITLYARWKYYTNVHPKNYDQNNGYAYIDTNTGGQWNKEKDTIKLTAYPAEGYRLKHWIDKNTKEVLSTDNPFNYVVDKGRVIEAVFVENKYTVTFDSRGGTPIESQVVNPGEKATRPTDPTKNSTDVVFMDWYKEKEFINNFVFRTTNINDDIDLYARWRIRHEVYPKYKDNDPKGRAYFDTTGAKVTDLFIAEGTSIDIVAQAYEGYEFVEWRLGSENGELLSENNPYTITCTNGDNKVNLYAIFEPKYEVIFDYNGQTFKGNNDYSFSFVSEEEKTISNIIDEYDDASVLYRQNIYPQIIINDDYYIIEGWYLEPECTNEFDIINDKLTNSTTTLYANWEKLSLDDYVLDETNTESYADVYFNGYINKDGNHLEVCFKSGGRANLLFEEQTNNEVEEILTQLRNIAPSVADERGYRIAKPASEEIIYEVDDEFDNSHSYYLDYSYKDANGNYVYSKNNNVRVITNPAKRVEVKYGDRYKRLMIFLNILVEAIPITKINILKDTHYLEVGNSVIAFPFIEIEPEKATRSQLKYISSDTNVVTIDSEGDWGQFNGIAVGTATITVKAPNGISKTFKVVVKDKIIYVDLITLNKSTLELEKGKSEKLIANITPNNATDKHILWRINDPSIASIDQNGKVTAIKEGTTMIYAYSTDGSATVGSCFVTVTQPINSIKLNKTSLTLEKGKSEILKATISPTKNVNKTLSWSSSNTSVATVDSNGKVIAKKAGTATITVKTVNGKTATCKITVTQAATSVKLNKTSLTLVEGKSETLKATISPTDTTNKKLTWSSSNTRIATIDSNGKITGKKAGSVTITVKTSNNKSATCKVTVKEDKLAQPTLVAIYNSAHGADIRFKPVNNATDYIIMRKLNGVWSAIKTIKANSLTKEGSNYKYIDESVKNNYGQGYIYSVKAKSNNIESTYDSKGLPLYRLKQPSFKTITSTTKSKVNISWSKENCQGYEIQYSLDNGKTWIKHPEIKNDNSTSTTISNLKSNTKYVFRIRCQKTNEHRGTTWSQYSSWGSINVK